MNYTTSEATSNLIASLVKFQQDFQKASLKKDAQNPHLKNKYVSLDNILHVVRPLLSANSLVVVQALAGEYLTTCLYHSSGEYIKAEMPFNPMGSNKGTNALQELGGGITYARRYQLSALLGLSVDVDEDANGSKMTKEQLKKPVPAPKKKVTEAELPKLVDWLKNNPNRQDDFENYYELTASQKQFIIDNL